ncbi:MAG: hypothetical protein ACR2IE_04410 [Candidatus Sumerlaeaceae bacterium]
MKTLWADPSAERWAEVLRSYSSVVEAQGVRRLPELDQWYRNELPAILASRKVAYVTLDELVRITEWKMARGVWRQRNLVLVRGNAPEAVQRVSTEAFAAVPDRTAPVKLLSTLAGVGPATASAVVAAHHPVVYPFFDELVAAQIPQAEAVTFNLRYYAWYAGQLRGRAEKLGDDWTPARVEQALWANSGGKAAILGVPEEMSS